MPKLTAKIAEIAEIAKIKQAKNEQFIFAFFVVKQDQFEL